MKKFVCIDTSIFARLSLLEGEEGSVVKELLDKIYTKIDNGDLILLLPEVIKLELPKAVMITFDKLKEEVLLLHLKNPKKSGNITTNNYLGKKITAKAMGTISNFIKEIADNIIRTKLEIEKIFTHKKTVSIGLDSDLLVEAYKFYAIGNKPSKLADGNRGVGCIQSDCLIIASLEKYLKSQTDYQFFFCSDNKEDFADSIETSDMKIHPDINARFSHIKFYNNILDLLNKEFGASYSPEEVEKINEQALSISVGDSIQVEEITEAESEPEKLIGGSLNEK